MSKWEEELEQDVNNFNTHKKKKSILEYGQY